MPTDESGIVALAGKKLDLVEELNRLTVIGSDLIGVAVQFLSKCDANTKLCSLS